jgi:hypothetical protein
MRSRLYILSFIFLPTLASAAPPVENAVAPWELNKFIGKSLRGHAFEPLGIVGAADPGQGVIQMVGPQGQVATIHASMLVEGASLRAPSLTIGDIAAASTFATSGIPIVEPRIIVEEPEFE